MRYHAGTRQRGIIIRKVIVNESKSFSGFIIVSTTAARNITTQARNKKVKNLNIVVMTGGIYIAERFLWSSQFPFFFIFNSRYTQLFRVCHFLLFIKSS